MASPPAEILLIENEESLARKIRTMLERRGYHVAVANESPLALRLFLRHPSKYDVVLVDDSMPAAMGVPLAEGIARVRPDIPIIMLFGAVHTVPATGGLFVAASKQSRPEELVSAIYQLLPSDKRPPSSSGEEIA